MLFFFCSLAFGQATRIRKVFTAHAYWMCSAVFFFPNIFFLAQKKMKIDNSHLTNKDCTRQAQLKIFFSIHFQIKEDLLK